MKSLKSMVREALENFDEFSKPYHIIIQINKSDREIIELLTEGKWVPSEAKGYWQRLDNPNFDFEQLHVHIAKQKHINTKSQQVSWNSDGTRHDKKSFNNNFVGMETAKNIARNALNLGDDKILENVETQELLTESIKYIPNKSSIYVFKIVNKNNNQILNS